jgi:hypothetical protein
MLYFITMKLRNAIQTAFELKQQQLPPDLPSLHRIGDQPDEEPDPD